MIHHYLDASALVKRYVQEAGTRWVTHFLSREASIATATLGVVETAAAITRRYRRGDLSFRDLERAMGSLSTETQPLTMIELGQDVVDGSTALAPAYALRGSDLVHLASAFVLRDSVPDDDDVALVTSDTELADAARHAGFQVLNPEVEERRRKR